MKDLDLWPLLWKTLDALTAHYGPAIDQAAAELGIPVGEWYGWLMAARIFEPDPVSAQTLHVRSAYTAPEKLGSALGKGALLGLLEAQPDGDYRLTAAGRAGVDHLIQTAYAAMAPLSPLPQDDLLRLAGLLERVVEASLAAPEPPGKWCLRIARHLDPSADAPVMERIDQYLSDLSAYRDDAHLAAWQPHRVSGHAWEVFTLLWRGAASSLDELAERLAHRGYTRADYAAALDELAGRGWVSGGVAGYTLTEAGQTVREEAEETTDRYFYAPWDCLSGAEVADMRGLLEQLWKALTRVPA